ncbi:hypothetical protein ILYODFUR_001843 [Ilyodon furcidens]|uniref:Uncharacterized protein n=1 Tax=Ilyodon furcidens TaxID=33524 RepID=A0ABV0UR19_9TELE
MNKTLQFHAGVIKSSSDPIGPTEVQHVRQHIRLSVTNTDRLLLSFLRQLATLRQADVPCQAKVDPRDETGRFGRLLTCAGNRGSGTTARSRRTLGNDLGLINGMEAG